MPVKSPFCNFKLDDYLGSMANMDILDDLYSTEFVLSDDIWKKFELPHGDSLHDNGLCDYDVDSNVLSSIFTYDDLYDIRNHDCMWAGHCASKEHPSDENYRPIRPPQIIPPPVKYTPVPSGRSLLLKTQTTQQQQSQQHPQQQQTAPATLAPTNSSVPGLDSPPNSDDEETKVKTEKTETLQILQEAISECDLEDDSDLYDYFEDDDFLADEVEKKHQVERPEDEEEVEEPSSVPRSQVISHVAASDHCYHKDKNATMRMNSLGVDTPSDSEEEIDVVSVEKQTNRMAVCALPNNPTTRDRHQLQKTMASAIQKNSTIPRKPQQNESPGRQRGMKRSKHKATSLASPHKRRPYNHSSDSEPEPSEKRSMHNNMERQRRIDLRNAFEDLRMLVPDVSKRARAPKVVILREAASYCDRLGDIHEDKIREVEELRRQQRRLRARVSQLRLSLAAKHR